MAVKALVRGGGEMASGVAAALFRAGFRVVLTESETPRAIRRTVSFGEAVRSGCMQVEGITAVCTTQDGLDQAHTEGHLAVVIDPDAQLRFAYRPDVLVDAIMSKCNAGHTAATWAPLVIGLGPGFEAPTDCHFVVETQRGHHLGRFYQEGRAASDTGIPAEVGGFSTRRVVRAPVAGVLEPALEIGTHVSEGDLLATIGSVAVLAPIAGAVRGLMAPGLAVSAGEKIGDVDPGGRLEHCRYISDKARQIGSGVLAAVLWDRAGRPGSLPGAPEGG